MLANNHVLLIHADVFFCKNKKKLCMRMIWVDKLWLSVCMLLCVYDTAFLAGFKSKGDMLM